MKRTLLLLILLAAMIGLNAPFTQGQVSGLVLDKSTWLPINNALVSLQGTATRTTTDASGMFFLPLTAASSLRIVAASKGYYNTGLTIAPPASGMLFQMDPVVVGNNPNYNFMDSGACGVCHPDQFAQWDGSDMAKAGSNTWVYDIYDGTGSPGGMGGFVYTRDSVHASSSPESECASCHQPEPWIKQPYKALDPINNLSAGSIHGVSCEVCHKIADIDESKMNFPGIWPGTVTFNLPNDPLTLHQVQYGKLGDADFQMPGMMRPSYQPQLSGAICAACHQDKNDPDGNLNFEEPNGVVSEPTWEEWLSSPYSDPSLPTYRTCVDCHMPAYGATNAALSGMFTTPTRDPQTIRSHAIKGTSPAYLDNACEMTLSAQQVGTTLSVQASVFNNQTGHHLPTGVTVRNIVLVIEAWRLSDGASLTSTGTQTVHALGGVGNPTQGYYGGQPGKLFAKHNHDANGNGPTFYTDATGILWDTRIPAMATDTSNYSFDVPAGTGPVKVRARLIYRRAFRAFVDAKQWTTDGHGNPLEDIAAPHYGHLMEQSEWTSPGGTAVTPYGSGGNGLSIGHTGWPSISGSSFGITLAGAPAYSQATLLIGSSDSLWGVTPLPLDLTYLGAPGSSLLTSIDGQVGALVDNVGNANITGPLPPDPALIGVTLNAQWMVIGVPNTLGIALSDALKVTFQP